MIKTKEIFSQIGKIADRVIFGPQTSGTLVDILHDPNAPVTHLLVRTNEGDWRYFIEDDIQSWLTGKGIEVCTGNWQIGERYHTQTWGTGRILTPWSTIARNPFNLKRGRPSTSLPKAVEDILDSADIRSL